MMNHRTFVTLGDHFEQNIGWHEAQGRITGMEYRVIRRVYNGEVYVTRGYQIDYVEYFYGKYYRRIRHVQSLRDYLAHRLDEDVSSYCRDEPIPSHIRKGWYMDERASRSSNLRFVTQSGNIANSDSKLHRLKQVRKARLYKEASSSLARTWW